MIQAKDSIGRIAAQEPSSVAMFDRAGIEYCCHGGQTLEEACSRRMLSSQKMAWLLQNSKDSAADDEAPDWKISTFEFLIHRVLRREHDDLKDELRHLRTLALSMTEKYGSRRPELVVVRELIESLSSDLVAHMDTEEATVFPALLDLELTYLGERPASTGSTDVRALLHNMDEEHQSVGRTLQRLRQEAAGFCPRTGTGREDAEFYSRLRALYSGLRHDLHVENNVLFPRVLQVEEEVLRGTA